MSDLDELWTKPTGKDWYDTLEDDEQEWFDAVCAETKRRGTRPSTSAVAAAFERKFGRHVAPGTILGHLRNRTGLS